MTKRTIKKTVSAFIAMTAILFTLISVSPIGIHANGDEDEGVDVYSIVIEDELQ